MNQQPYVTSRILVEGKAEARALVHGGPDHPSLIGEVLFYPFHTGSLVVVRITGLPGSGFFGLHIHEHGDCRNGGDVPFFAAGGHYNPESQPHPNHAGDLPVLLSSGGHAYAIVYTGRFQPKAVIGRSVIVHDKPDDYRSQPAGDSGTRIACGVIEAVR